MGKSADSDLGRFSKARFVEAAKESRELEKLCDELRCEISARLHQGLVDEMEAVVKRLNDLGHSLKLRYDPVPGDIHYRDRRGRNVDLLIGCDNVVTVSFKDAIDYEE